MFKSDKVLASSNIDLKKLKNILNKSLFIKALKRQKLKLCYTKCSHSKDLLE